MNPRDSVTLKELDDKWQDVRAWCFDCARGERIDTEIWQKFHERGWDQTLSAAAARFRCKRCKSSAHVALFPIRRPDVGPITTESMVAAIFFGARKAAKKRIRN